MPVLAWLANLATSSFAETILWPSLSKWLGAFFAGQAAKVEVKTAVKIAKAAKTADDLRDASKRLTDASNRT